ncbi:MAG: response regulator transcription factor [Dehalococcoidia bacterium]|nr:response regulator transcription factor [Dehalococcoidia bacterium]
MDPKVLIVDDDDAILKSLKRGLELEKFNVYTANGGRNALDIIESDPPDIIVLDINMPDIDGITVTQRLRKKNIQIPICILSARDETTDRVIGLESGADDYLVKPFALQELIARLRALIRRAQVIQDNDQTITIQGLAIDPQKHLCLQNGEELKLTRKEFELLYILAQNPNIVFNRKQLLHKVWGYDFAVETNVVDVFIGYLRKKLETNNTARIIHTVHSVGFVLKT